MIFRKTKWPPFNLNPNLTGRNESREKMNYGSASDYPINDQLISKLENMISRKWLLVAIYWIYSNCQCNQFWAIAIQVMCETLKGRG